MSSTSRAQTQVTKSWNQNPSVAWSGTTVTIELDGDYPIKGLAIHLNAAATVTFEAVIDGDDYTVLNGGSALSVDMTTLTDVFVFVPELAAARSVKLTATASQSTATVKVLNAS